MIMQSIKNEIIFENDIHWNSRFQYFNLLQKYLKSQSAGEEFLDDFYQLWDQDLARTEDLSKNLERQNYILVSNRLWKKERKTFGKILHRLFYLCEIVDMELPEIYDGYHNSDRESKWDISESEFRNSLEREILPEFLKYCPEFENDSHTVLLETMTLLTIVSSLSYSFLKPEFLT